MRIRDSVAQNLHLGGPEFAAPKFPYILTQGLDPLWPKICTSFTSYGLTQGLDRRWPKIDSLKCSWPKKNTISYRSGFASFSVCAFAHASPWIPHARQRICVVRGGVARGSAKIVQRLGRQRVRTLSARHDGCASDRVWASANSGPPFWATESLILMNATQGAGLVEGSR
jgi:hypothetical protein